MDPKILSIIKEQYPSCHTQTLADQLNLSIHQLRKIVSKYKIKKNDTFKKQMYENLHDRKLEVYERNIKTYHPSQIENNIIIGSLLGDASIACYGRSKTPYFREHGCKKQGNYRKWKSQMLKSLDFKYFPNYKYPSIKSPSNPLYDDYQRMFYPKGTKSITDEVLKHFNHPIALLCLYLDDGSLVIDRYIRNNKVHLFPRITLYTQSFTKEENLRLLNHLKHKFNVNFILKTRKDGSGFVLQCNYRDEIIKFLALIKNDHPLLDCMRYKLNLAFALNKKIDVYQNKFPNHQIIVDRYK